ncbi:hypothetical protein BGS_0511 [Beggiatoa sp. SS]|nr:hypothetical protein BGS_0511 [Beggiatoa sp. SS]
MFFKTIRFHFNMTLFFKKNVNQANPLWLPFVLKYLFICASVLTKFILLLFSFQILLRLIGVQNLFCFGRLFI